MIPPYDDNLHNFAVHGAAPLPASTAQGTVAHDGAQIWYASYGDDTHSPVILLHGGLGHSGNWGYQVPALIEGGYRVIVIDSRGHGRSTRDVRPYSYNLLATDLLAVMDALAIPCAALVGWSDGAVIALTLAMQAPARVTSVYFFGCNMDPSGTKEIVFGPVLERCFTRHAQDYAQLSATPAEFDVFVAAVSQMQSTQPNATAADLAQIRVPVTIVHSEHDEFIQREHAEYLARSIPGAAFVLLPAVSHFAPLQRPDLFNRSVLASLDTTHI